MCALNRELSTNEVKDRERKTTERKTPILSELIMWRRTYFGPSKDSFNRNENGNGNRNGREHENADRKEVNANARNGMKIMAHQS